MTALDLEIPEALRADVDATLGLAEREHATTDLPTGTPRETLGAVLAAKLDRLALVDADLPAFAEILIGVATAFPAAAVVLTMHASVLHLAITRGSPAQRARIEDRGLLWGFGAAPAVDEPRATVERRGSGAALHGALRRVSGAGLVQGLAVLVPYGDRSAILVVETSRPGIEIDDAWQSAGLRASATRRVRFRDVTVERDDVVALVGGAEELASWETAMLGLSAISAGIARRAALEAIARATSAAEPEVFRAQSGTALGAAIEEAVAAMSVTRALAARARRGAPDRVALLGAKAATAAMAERAVSAARSVVGMDAFEAPHPLERLARDVLGVRHFFPVEPIANDLVWRALATDAAGAPTTRTAGGARDRRS
jgi:alkylation response protein AidB-like acyl-CoA dehydrogenase